MASYDGTIKFDTSVDSDGLEKGIKNLPKILESINDSFKSIQMAIEGVETSGQDLGKSIKKIPTDVSKATDYFKKMDSSSAKVSNNTERIEAPLNKVSRDMQNVENNTEKASKHTKKMKNNLSGMPASVSLVRSGLAKIAGLLGTTFAVGAIINFAKESLALGSDLQEVQNVVDTSFGDMSYKIEDFVKTSIKNFGLGEVEAKKFASVYASMGVGIGLGLDEATDKAIELTKRTADVASFYNLPFEQAQTMLKSIYTGETESLKNIGVVMTEFNLQQFAMQQGITKSIDKMTQAEKVQLRYDFVLRQTSLAMGDFAKTSGKLIAN